MFLEDEINLAQLIHIYNCPPQPHTVAWINLVTSKHEVMLMLQFWFNILVQTFGFESTWVIITTLTLYILSRMPRRGMRSRAGPRGHTPPNTVQSRKYRSSPSSSLSPANTVKLADTHTCIHDTRLTDGGEIILTTQDISEEISANLPPWLHSHLLPVSMNQRVVSLLTASHFEMTFEKYFVTIDSNVRLPG